MKKLEKIKLNQLSSVELNEREMCQLLGGAGCQCGCNYAYSGGSSSSENDSANRAGGLTSDPTTTPAPTQGSLCNWEPAQTQDSICNPNFPLCNT